MKKTKPWRQSFRRTPDHVLDKLPYLGSSIQVGVTKKILHSALEAGDYQHLGLNPESLEGGIVALRPTLGPWSRKNHYGWKEVHRDRPRETFEVCFDAHSWGGGTHQVCYERERYPRTFHAPEHLVLSVELLEKHSDGIVVKFLLDAPLDVGDPDFEQQLFQRGNLLQENVGGVDVFGTNATRAEYLETLMVDWKLLPIKGLTPTEILERAGLSHLPPVEKERLLHRMVVLKELQPQAWIVGAEGFQRYLGAKMASNLAVFENVNYGNAIYVFGADWEILSKLSRTELLNGDGYDFTRIPHYRNWPDRLRDEIARRRPTPPPSASDQVA